MSIISFLFKPKKNMAKKTQNELRLGNTPSQSTLKNA